MLITVTLLAFLVLLLVSLASLTRVETQVASNSQQLSAARQNALMALNIALGELQKYAGPDQRATARADIQETSATPPVDGAKRWTGVWGNTANPQTGLASSPKLLQWLVSGNEGTSFNPASQVSYDPASFGQIATTSGAPAITPDAAISGLAAPFDDIKIGGEQAVLLVGPASVGSASGVASDYVAAPLVDIKASPASVPGSDPAGGDVLVGRYAYWVGDEGIKARVNMVDPYVTPTAQMTAAGVVADAGSSFRLMAPQHLGVDQVAGFENFPVNDLKISSILDDSQMSLADADLKTDARQARFHDFTTLSSAVLDDQLHGGLKRDLTFAFARNDLGQYQSAIRDPMRTITTGGPNPLLSAVLHADPAYNPSAVSSATLMAEQGPTWEQLRSYARLGGAIDASGKITPRIQTGEDQGIYPILVQARMGFGGQVDAVDATYARFTNHFYPSFVLANPYDVTIAASKYRVRVFFGAGKYSVYVGGETTPRAGMSKTLRELFDGAVFELNCPDLAPGEARVFTLDSAARDVPWAENKVYPCANEWDQGFARIVVPFDTQIERTVCEGDASGKRLGLHPIFSDAGSQTWQLDSNGEPTLTAGTNTVADTMGWALTNENDQVYQRYDNYKTPAGGARITPYGYKGPIPIVAGPQSYLLFRLAETGNFGGMTTTGNYYTQVPFYPYYALGNIRAPMVSIPAWYAAKNIYSSFLWGQGFEQNASSSSTPTFAYWIRLDPSGSGYEKVEWQGVRRSDQMSDLDQAQTQWAMADVPREPDGPISGMVSVGQLQHFNAGGYNDGETFPAADASVPLNPRPSSDPTWRPRHVSNPNPIGNSRANPYVQRDRVRQVNSSEPYYDQSYLLNRQLFDGYFFSTFPQDPSQAVDLRTYRLANSTLVPFRSEVAPDDPSQFRGGAAFDANDVFLPARNLMQRGGFNVNSTSVAAWRAVLGAFKDTDFNGETGLSGPFVRSIHQLKGSDSATNGISENAWNGFRNLSPAQLDALAAQIVDQIKQRGVSISLADFINRKLTPDPGTGAETAATRLGLCGPIQAAIDAAAINPHVAAMQNWNGTSAPIGDVGVMSSGTYNPVFPYPRHLPIDALEGIAGWLTQADVVQALAPLLTARSDTFRIRAYGETRNPVTQQVTGRAWCEAIVQRLPDYISGANDAIDTGMAAAPALTKENEQFGRRFVIISFRWLTPQDI